MKFLLDFVLAHERSGKVHRFGMSDVVVSGFMLVFILPVTVYLIKRYKNEACN